MHSISGSTTSRQERRRSGKESWIAMICKIEVELFSLTSSRSFDEVLAPINDAVGHLDMTEFWRSTHQARTVVELENSIQKVRRTRGPRSATASRRNASRSRSAHRIASFIRSKTIRRGRRQRRSAFRRRLPKHGSFTPKRPSVNRKCRARSTSPVLISRALTGIGRVTAVAFSRALSLNKADIKSAKVR
jgi:hypothetical protein